MEADGQIVFFNEAEAVAGEEAGEAVETAVRQCPQKSKTWEDFQYAINQEKYLKVFLDDGEVPMDNNAAEQSSRGLCIGKKNWVMNDTVAGKRERKKYNKGSSVLDVAKIKNGTSFLMKLKKIM